MRIAVFGATGMAGTEIVAEALRRGHAVTAVSRRPDGTEGQERLTRVRADVADAAEVEQVLEGADAAVLSVRLPPGQEQGIAGITATFLTAARAAEVPVLIIGGSAPLRSPNDPALLVLDDRAFVPEAWVSIAAASLDQFKVCREHLNQNWTYLSPPAIFQPGPRLGTYRRGQDTLLLDADGTSTISAADFAIAVLDELESPSGQQHFTVVSDRSE